MSDAELMNMENEMPETTCFTLNGLREIAEKLEIPLLSAIPAGEAITFQAYKRWVADGNATGMAYLEEHADARRHPENVLPGVRTVIMLGFPLETVEKMAIQDGRIPPATRWLRKFPPETLETEIPPGFGLVAEYATSGIDYHDVIRRRLKAFQKELKCRFPKQISRGIVDTAPFLEREFAERAGIGFVGRNRMLIHPEFGSFLFLAAILTTENLENHTVLPDFQKMRRMCETCGRCQRNCPTGALTEAGVDARKCLSALTVESRGAISEEMAGKMGIRVLGCDECQRVCPWNQAFISRRARTVLELEPIMKLGESGFREAFAHTPFWRATWEGMVRNAEICRTEKEKAPPSTSKVI